MDAEGLRARKAAKIPDLCAGFGSHRMGCGSTRKSRPQAYNNTQSERHGAVPLVPVLSTIRRDDPSSDGASP